MKKRVIGGTDFEISPIVMGCMRLTRLGVKEAGAFIENAVGNGVNFFDHADIYDGGKCEELFGQALKASSISRDMIFVQTKCGIVPGKMYDLSSKHIIESVEGSLKRLQLDYVDSLLLHRPDALIEPEEVAEAFYRLAVDGKVRYFGVSNFNSMQIQLLQKYVKQPVVFNQMQISAAHCPMITQGLEVNMATDGAINRDGSVLDFCRLNNITVQAWSPFQHGFIEGTFMGVPEYKKLNDVLEKIAGEKREEMGLDSCGGAGAGGACGGAGNITATTIAAAWLLRHPCNMQVIAGTMNMAHFNEICQAREIELSRQQWYEIYMAAGNMLP